MTKKSPGLYEREPEKKVSDTEEKRKEKMFLQPVKKIYLWERNRCDGRKVSEKGELSRKRTVTRDALGLYLL